MPHPLFSPDMAPSDYWLFAPLKRFLANESYTTFRQLKAAVKKWVDSVPEDFFAKGIERLPSLWDKCIKAKGEYFE